jgi:hypothetical protein
MKTPRTRRQRIERVSIDLSLAVSRIDDSSAILFSKWRALFVYSMDFALVKAAVYFMRLTLGLAIEAPAGFGWPSMKQAQTERERT